MRLSFDRPPCRVRLYSIGLLLGALLLSGCAGASETASSVPAAVGVWAYQAESRQGTYRGTLTITQSEAGALRGSIDAADESVGPLEVQEVALQDSTLTLDVGGGSVGPMTVTATLRGDRLEGSVDVAGYGPRIPFSAERQRE
jgi:hypothetical protein